jgi:hypothetical protein
MSSKGKLLTIEKEIFYHTYESTNRFFTPKRWAWQPSNQSSLSSKSLSNERNSQEVNLGVNNSNPVESSVEEAISFASTNGKIPTFKFYSSNCEYSTIKLEVNNETSTGNMKR